MCGICCAVRLPSESKSNSRQVNGYNGDDLETGLKAGLERIAHRGPDAQGHWVSEDGRVGMVLSLASDASYIDHMNRLEQSHSIGTDHWQVLRTVVYLSMTCELQLRNRFTRTVGLSTQ